MNRFILLIAVLLAFTAAAHAQDSSKHNAIGIGIVGESIASHDLVGSPLIYAGPGFGVHAMYLHRDSSELQHAVIGLTLAPLSANVSDPVYGSTHLAIAALAELRYGYERSVRSLSTREVQSYAGAALSSSLFLRRYYYRQNVQSDIGSASGEGVISLDAVASALHDFGSDTRASFTLRLPLVAYVARPAWGLSPGFDESYLSWLLRIGAVKVLGQYAAWGLELNAERDLGSYFRVELSFHNDYFHFKRDEWPSSSIRTYGIVSLQWRFGS